MPAIERRRQHHRALPGACYVRVRKPPCACAALCRIGDGRLRAIDPLHVRSPLAIDGEHPAEGF